MHGSRETFREFAEKVILVVKDEMLLAMDLAARLEEMGATVLGPASDVRTALTLIANRSIDAALLDINLQAETSYPIADRLIAEGVPFVFVTSMSRRVVPEGYREYVVDKMSDLNSIAAALWRPVG